MSIRLALMGLIMLSLLACGNAPESAQEAAGQDGSAIESPRKESVDVTTAGADNMEAGAEQARDSAERASLPMRKVDEHSQAAMEMTQSRIAGLWSDAMDRSEQARDQAAAALDAARRGDSEALGQTRSAGRAAMEQAEAAWEQASEHAGPAWQQMRETTNALLHETRRIWEQIDQLTNERES